MGIDIGMLKEKMREKKHTPDAVAEAMGMNTSTYYRKLNAQGVKFTIGEMQLLIEFLELTNDEAMRLFFRKAVA